MFGLYGTFYWTPLEVNEIGFTQKIFYFHVPMAITSGMAFGVTLVASILFLVTKNLKWDTWAVVGAELGLIFGSALLWMGIIWQRSTWGVWWTWDPRLTSFLVVMLLYGAYFVLRSSVETPVQRARYSASIGIVGYLAVLFTMLSTRILRSVHPVLFRLSDSGLGDSSMLITFLVAMFAMFALLAAILILKTSVENLGEELDYLKSEIGG
jgi:heme exporter protein C